jgi:hypothetical protein
MMLTERNKLYVTILTASFAGYVWILLSLKDTLFGKPLPSVCLLKNFTNIPCPSCGSTRSVMLLTKGHFLDALLLNPVGYLIALIMIIFPIWIVGDIITGKFSCLQIYVKIESGLKNPKYLIPLAVLIMINWFWNIKKGL